MRDKRNNQIHKMDPKLFHKFVHIQNNLGLQNSEIQIICGYRSPASNSAMLRSGRGVARNSYHTRGQAIDFRIEGVSLAKLRQTAENLKMAVLVTILAAILFMWIRGQFVLGEVAKILNVI